MADADGSKKVETITLNSPDAGKEAEKIHPDIQDVQEKTSKEAAKFLNDDNLLKMLKEGVSEKDVYEKVEQAVSVALQGKISKGMEDLKTTIDKLLPEIKEKEIKEKLKSLKKKINEGILKPDHSEKKEGSEPKTDNSEHKPESAAKPDDHKSAEDHKIVPPIATPTYDEAKSEEGHKEEHKEAGKEKKKAGFFGKIFGGIKNFFGSIYNSISSRVKGFFGFLKGDYTFLGKQYKDGKLVGPAKDEHPKEEKH